MVHEFSLEVNNCTALRSNPTIAGDLEMAFSYWLMNDRVAKSYNLQGPQISISWLCFNLIKFHLSLRGVGRPAFMTNILNSSIAEEKLRLNRKSHYYVGSRSRQNAICVVKYEVKQIPIFPYDYLSHCLF